MDLEKLKKRPDCFYYTDNGVLLCGDCLKIMPELEPVDLVLTDPPYGTTQNKWDSVIPLSSMWDKLKNTVKCDGAIVLTSQSIFTANIQVTSPFFRYSLIWEKTKAGGFLNSRRMPLQAHEDITVHYRRLPTYNPQMEPGEPYTKKAVSDGDGGNYGTFNRAGEVAINAGERFPRSVLRFSNDNHNSLHPTQKPVALMEYLIKTYTNEGETVLDFTVGSGTTIVACEKLNRRWIGIEIEEKYCEIAKQRIEKERSQLKLW